MGPGGLLLRFDGGGDVGGGSQIEILVILGVDPLVLFCHLPLIRYIKVIKAKFPTTRTQEVAGQVGKQKQTEEGTQKHASAVALVRGCTCRVALLTGNELTPDRNTRAPTTTWFADLGGCSPRKLLAPLGSSDMAVLPWPGYWFWKVCPRGPLRPPLTITINNGAV